MCVSEEKGVLTIRLGVVDKSVIRILQVMHVSNQSIQIKIEGKKLNLVFYKSVIG